MSGIPDDPGPFRDPWYIDAGAIRKGTLLGEGFFGKVYNGTLNGTREVALKYLNNEHPYLQQLIAEAELIRDCNHTNILKTIGICTSLRVIVTEKMANGCLKMYLRSNDLATEDCLTVAQQIASGMIYLVQMGIVHRDLAARNVLVGDTIDTIKIADFGLSRILEDNGCYTTLKDVFPVEWTAPEGFSVPCTITSAADVWSYAVLLWELYANGDDPYTEIVVTRQTLFRRLTEEEYRLDCPPKCPAIIYEWMLACWRIDPDNRPSFDELLDMLSVDSSELLEPSDPSGMHFEQDDRPTHFFSNWYSEQTPRQPSITSSRASIPATARQSVQQPQRSASTTALSVQAAGKRCVRSAANGSYLRANEPAWQVDMVQRPPRDWENWYIEDWKAMVVLKGRGAPNKPGQFLRAYPNGAVDLTGAHPKNETRAIWRPFRNDNGTWSFLSEDGRWLSARRDGSVYTVEHCREWEEFQLEYW